MLSLENCRSDMSASETRPNVRKRFTFSITEIEISFACKKTKLTKN